jgi:hypothetical protein
MPAKPNEDRLAREVADTLVKDDGIELGRAKEAVQAVLLLERGRDASALTIYRAARQRLRIDDVEPEDELDVDDDARPTLVVPPKQKPSRKGTRKDTPIAKKDSKKK